MGTTAMDKQGNMGLAFSYSGDTLYPGIAYTGRLAGDALGFMTQGENVAQVGLGYQTSSYNRWGDYASMNIDPTDGKWITNDRKCIVLSSCLLGSELDEEGGVERRKEGKQEKRHVGIFVTTLRLRQTCVRTHTYTRILQ
jgi:hypothetical protein